MLRLILKRVLVAHQYIHEPKLPLDGRIYTLTVGSVLTTNAYQTNLCQLLFRATLKVRLDSRLSLLLEWITLTATIMNAHFKNSQLVYGRGSFTSGSKHYTSPTSPPYVAKQLTVLFPTQLLCSFLVNANVVPTIYCAF